MSSAHTDAVEAFGPDGALARTLPGFVPRPSQQALAGFAATVFAERGVGVVEAGTGTGKTYAYLVPALLSPGRAVISTGTRPLQDQLHARDLPTLLAALGVERQVALLKGRANYVCRHHLRDALQGGGSGRYETVAQLHRIDAFARHSVSGDRAECTEVPEDADAWGLATSTADDCLGQDCPDWNACYVVRARREALAADVVVVNHHLFAADLALRDGGVAELLPQADVLVFDEAHLLPDVCAQFLGETVSARQLDDLARDVRAAGLAEAADAADWRLLADALVDATRQLRAAWPAGGGRIPSASRLEADLLLRGPRFAAALELLTDRVGRMVVALVPAAERGPGLARLAERARRLEDALAAWRGEGRDAAADDSIGVRWGEAAGTTLVLHRTPVVVAGPLQRQRETLRAAWLFVSATLAVGDDFSGFLGQVGAPDATTLRLPSPFDLARQAMLYVPDDVGLPNLPDHTTRLMARCAPLLAANRGRAFVLCTSLRAVREAAAWLRQSIEAPTDLEVLVQGESTRQALIDRFRTARAPVLVGSASFWQGIDVQGAQLSLVIIDKLPFASPDDPLLRARGEALERAGQDAFMLLQLPAAAIALKQGAGRLIRSERDRGLLVVGDERLLKKGYGKRLLAGLSGYPVTRDVDDALAFVQAGG